MQPAPRWFCLALTLLLVGVPQVAGQAEATFTAKEALMLGETTTNGTLTVLVQENGAPQDVPGSPAFQLQAAILHVETDHTNASIHPGVTEHRHEPYTTKETYENAVVRGIQHRPNYVFLVYPLGPVSVLLKEPVCARLEGAGAGSVEHSALVRNDREPDSVPLHDSLHMNGCLDVATLRLEGDFLLRLWEWDAELQAGPETRSLTSGKDPGPIDKVMAPATEQYLHAHNATLRIPELLGTYHLYLHQAATAGAASARLRDATVDLPGMTLSGQEVELRGLLELDMQRESAGLVGSVVGVEQASADGTPWLEHALTVDGEPAWWPWLLGLGILVVLSGGWAWRASRRRAWGHGMQGGFHALCVLPAVQQARRLHETALRHHGARFNRQAVWCLSRAIRLDADNGEHYSLRGHCRASLGHVRRALRDHTASHARALDAETAAQAAYEVSRTHAVLGRAGPAAHWLRMACQCDPDYAQLSIMDAAYEEVAADPVFQAVARQSSPRNGGAASSSA